MSGDSCSTIIPLALSNGTATTTGTLVGYANNKSTSCLSSSGADLVYSLTLTANQSVTATVTPTSGSWEPAITLFGGSSCSGSPEEACGAGGTANAPASLTTSALAAGTWYLWVDARSGGTVGAFSLTVTVTTQTPTGGGGGSTGGGGGTSLPPMNVTRRVLVPNFTLTPDQITISPDQTRVAYRDSQSVMYLDFFPGATPQQACLNADAYRWSPTGRHLMCFFGTTVTVVPVTGFPLTPRVLTTQAVAKEGTSQLAEFASDGMTVWFLENTTTRSLRRAILSPTNAAPSFTTIGSGGTYNFFVDPSEPTMVTFDLSRDATGRRTIGRNNGGSAYGTNALHVGLTPTGASYVWIDQVALLTDGTLGLGTLKIIDLATWTVRTLGTVSGKMKPLFSADDSTFIASPDGTTSSWFPSTGSSVPLGTSVTTQAISYPWGAVAFEATTGTLRFVRPGVVNTPVTLATGVQWNQFAVAPDARSAGVLNRTTSTLSSIDFLTGQVRLVATNVNDWKMGTGGASWAVRTATNYVYALYAGWDWPLTTSVLLDSTSTSRWGMLPNSSRTWWENATTFAIQAPSGNTGFNMLSGAVSYLGRTWFDPSGSWLVFEDQDSRSPAPLRVSRLEDADTVALETRVSAQQVVWAGNRCVYLRNADPIAAQTVQLVLVELQ